MNYLRIALALLPGVAAASVFHLDGDRITLVAEDEPLPRILRMFSDAGVAVHVDPEISARVSPNAVDRPLESVFPRLFEPLGYTVVWDIVRGPVGDLPRLAEIRVFRQGREDAAKPLLKDSSNFRIATGPTADGAPYVADEVLLRLRPGVSAAEFRHLLAQLGGTLVSSIPELGIYQVRFPPGSNIPALIDQLAKNALVETAEPNYVARLPDLEQDADRSPRGSVPPVRAGAPRVAILDSGLLPSAAMGDSVAGAFDAVSPERPLTDPAGHGTQMALIASGAIAPVGGSRGDGVPLLAIRAFDDNGHASSVSLMRAMSYAIENGARVINMSWGTDTRSQFIGDAIDYAQKKGLIVVASAGNEGSNRSVYPASYPGVVAVSALNPDGTVWNRSNFGGNITLAAPGRASFPIGYRGPPGAYAGTSIASAYTARQLALYFTANPGATPQQAMRALEQAVTDRGPSGHDPRYGFGALDAAALSRLLD